VQQGTFNFTIFSCIRCNKG